MSKTDAMAMVGPTDEVGQLPKQSGWAVEMYGDCVLFASNAEKAQGRSPGATVRIYTEAQCLGAVAAERERWQTAAQLVLNQIDALPHNMRRYVTGYVALDDLL